MKGKKRGFQKTEVKITDPTIHPYYVVVDENQFSVMLENSTIPQGYYSTLARALQRIAHYKNLSTLNQKEVSLQQFIDEYRTTVNIITETVKV